MSESLVLSFDQSLFLLLLPLPLALLLWSLLRGRRGARPESRWRRLGEGGLRAATLLLLVVALAQPQLRLPAVDAPLTIAVDVSRSVAPIALAQLLPRLEAMPDAGRASWLAFADRPVPVDDAEALRELPVGATGEGALDRLDSDLAAALAFAASAGGEGGRILLATDGRETRGSLRALLPELAERGVSVHPLPLPSAPAEGTAIAALEPCPRPRVGAPCAVGVTLQSETAREITLTAHFGEETSAAVGVSLEVGSRRVRLPVTPAVEGPNEVELRLEDASGDVLDRASLGLVAAPRHRVLFVSGDPARDRFLPTALERAGFELLRRSAAELPSRLEALADVDVVVLSDLLASSLDDERQRTLDRFVGEEGGGLLFVSGESTFGEEGWAESELERTLPVRFRVREEESDIALMIVLDKSYSMRGDKIALARTASLAALDVLEEDHRYGLIAFDWNPTLVVPLQPASEREAIRRQVERIDATAQTNFFPALEMAHARLREVPARTRHVILLSDGKTYPDAYERLLAEMRDDDITVSTIAVGDEADRELLEQIAEWGGGRSYFIADARRVVGVMVDETRTTVRDTLVERPTEVIARLPGAALAGLDLDRLPPLAGHVATTLKDRAEAWLVSEEDEPLLASWRYGLGRATVFTSDARNRWAADWVGWPGFQGFWARVVRDLAGGHLADRFELELDDEGERLVVTVQATDAAGRPRDGLLPVARLGSRETVLPQVAPGTYRTRLDTDGRERRLDLELLIEGTVVGRRIVDRPLPAELQLGEPDLALLGEAAARTGGQLLSDPADLAEPLPSGRAPARPLWHWLTALALLLFLAELLLRRRPALGGGDSTA